MGFVALGAARGAVSRNPYLLSRQIKQGYADMAGEKGPPLASDGINDPSLTGQIKLGEVHYGKK
jgi:hypothetical protein